MLERQIDFPSIVASKEDSVMKLRTDNYELLVNFAVMCAKSFLEICYPNQVHIAPVIASDLIETRPTWRAADFINLFKFLRQRQDLEELRVMGNQITVPKLMEMVAVYEDHRAMALEQHHAGKKGEITTKHEKLNELAEKVAQKFKDKNEVVLNDGGMGKEYDKIQAERERTGKDVLYKQVAPDEKFFDKINSK